MLEYLTPGSQFSAFILEASESTSFYLYVEGDDDRKMLSEHLSSHLVLRKIEGGKGAAIRLASAASESGASRLKVLVDKDFDHLLGTLRDESHHSLITTTYHDAFMDIAILHPALVRKLIMAYLDILLRSSRDVEADLKAIFERVLSLACNLAVALTRVRMAAVSLGLNIRFRGFDFRAFASAEDLSVSGVVGQLRRTNALGPVSESSVAELCLRAASNFGDDAEVAYLVGDHDLFAAIAAALGVEHVQASRDGLQRDFISSVSCHHLRATSWFLDIGYWSTVDGVPGFRCIHEGHCDSGT